MENVEILLSTADDLFDMTLPEDSVDLKNAKVHLRRKVVEYFDNEMRLNYDKAMIERQALFYKQVSDWAMAISHVSSLNTEPETVLTLLNALPFPILPEKPVIQKPEEVKPVAKAPVKPNIKAKAKK